MRGSVFHTPCLDIAFYVINSQIQAYLAHVLLSGSFCYALLIDLECANI